MMNERIRLLAEQAGITTNLDTDFFVEKDVNKWMDYYSQKFAELIVRECIDRVRDQYSAQRDLLNRTEREQGRVECGVASVVALEELVQESTDRWYKENILED